MQKAQGTSFKRQKINLELCPICKGKAMVEGLFHELACTDCNGSGWVVSGCRLVLSSGELLTQLSFKLQQAQRELAALKGSANVVGLQRHYEQTNRLGAGGTNYTGD